MDYKNLDKKIKIKMLRYGLATLSILGYGTDKAKAQDIIPQDSIPQDGIENKIGLDSLSKSMPENTFVMKDTIAENDIKKDAAGEFSVYEKNLKTAKEAFNDIFVMIAYTENFSEKRYHCGARYTIAYGNTVLENGKRVTKYTKPVTMEKGKELVFYHVEQHVFPYIKYIEKELNKSQIEAVCSFIYNVGGEYFSGLDKEGKPALDRYGKRREMSEFLQAINNGEDDYICAQRMLQSHTSAGRVAWGLFKRRWVEAALYTGKLKSSDILNFKVRGLYLNNDISKLYSYSEKDKKIISFRGLNNVGRRELYKRFLPKLDDETINWFKEFNKADEKAPKTVLSIVDNETAILVNRNEFRKLYGNIIDSEIKRPALFDEIKVKPIQALKINIQPQKIINKKNKKLSR